MYSFVHLFIHSLIHLFSFLLCSRFKDTFTQKKNKKKTAGLNRWMIVKRDGWTDGRSYV